MTIQIVAGDVAPRFEHPTSELTPVACRITENGMASGLPLVDFEFADPDGKRYAFVTSGRMIRAIAAAIGGMNQRNHGTTDP